MSRKTQPTEALAHNLGSQLFNTLGRHAFVPTLSPRLRWVAVYSSGTIIELFKSKCQPKAGGDIKEGES